MDCNNKLIIAAVVFALVIQGQSHAMPKKKLPALEKRISKKVLETRVKQWRIKKRIVSVRESEKAPSWRYCHDGNKLCVMPFFGTGKTGTKYKLVQTRTLEEAIADIKKRGLKIEAEAKRQLKELVRQHKDEAGKYKNEYQDVTDDLLIDKEGERND